jgi:hypothetical protein
MVRELKGKNLDPDLEQKEKTKKNLDRLAGQPIQIWNKKTKKRPCKRSGLAKK